MTRVTGLRAETSATAAIATLSVAVAATGHALAGGTVSLQSLPQLLALAAIAWSTGEHVAGRRWHSITLLALLQLTTHLTLELSHRAPRSVATAAAASAADTASGSSNSSANSSAVQAAHTAMDHAAMDHAAMGHAAMGHAAMGHSSMHDMAGVHDMAGMHDLAGMAGMAMSGGDASAGVGSGSLASAASGGLAGAAPGDMARAMHSGFAGVVSMSAAHLFVLLVGVALVTQAHRWVHRVAGIVARLVPQVPAPGVALPVLRAVLVGVPEVPRVIQRWLVAGVSRRGPPVCGVLAASY
ncbi:hypothetical protein [Kribbella sp. NPDC051620]|uniref:hypothetical protein n=1 Tax=Kribbella sp. NPDC051620 TaxID=3364120 RepID=UPI0037B13AF9